MSYKYSKIRSIESIRDGIQYMVTKFVTSDDTDEIPVVGVLADWTPTTSYVIGVEKVPDSQHSIYKITAKDVSDILEETDLKGRKFHKTIFVTDATLTVNTPIIGADVTWGRVDSYVLEYKITPCGSNWMIDIIAVEEEYKVL